jgi:hypothetical protein
MGYTSGHPCFLDLNMLQTPRNLQIVRELAGWTYAEAAAEIAIGSHDLARMEAGEFPFPMSPDKWRLYIKKAGSRAFDYDEDSL